MALISLDHVSKMYPKGTRPALDDINLDIERGDFVFLVGASGSGKSTLLSLLLHEEEATDGEIRVAGNDLRRITNRQVPQYRRSLGFVFQDYKLLNNKTVWQNVAFALEVIGMRRSSVKSLVPKVLETVGLTGKEKSYPHELSGGEQQRVAIARAYVNHPQILLADEPTGNLDPTTSLGIMEVLDAINRTGTTVVMATHNEEIVNSMRKRVVELHTGKIVRDEEHGSYDSAEFFPDAEVTSKSHQALEGDAKFRPAAAANGEAEAAEVAASGNGITEAGHEDEGIARLAQSVHSGRTGRYGEAFASLEDTLTWGKGIDLDLQAGKDGAEKSDPLVDPAGNPADGADKSADADGDTDKAYADAPNPTDTTDTANVTDAPSMDENTSREAPGDSAALLAPPTPPAPPADSTSQPSAEEENR